MEQLSEMLEHELTDAVEVKKPKSLHLRTQWNVTLNFEEFERTINLRRNPRIYESIKPQRKMSTNGFPWMREEYNLVYVVRIRKSVNI